jgi:bacterioferritin (cytochrome b1)
MMNETTIDRLNDFLRGELSAVETYDLALQQTKHEGFGSTLRQLRDAHERRIGTIRDKILQLGGAPAASSGAWGTFAGVVQAGADLFGNVTAVSTLEEGEDHGLKMYRDALQQDDVMVREFVDAMLLPGQRRSHDLCRSLKSYAKAS